jgi:hypothetical protein
LELRFLEFLFWHAKLIMKDNWIPTSERQPDLSGWYLTCNGEHIEIACFLTHGNVRQWYDCGNASNKVTHWMPLPNLPQKKNGSDFILKEKNKTLRSQLAEAMELLSMCEIPSDPARIDEWRHRVEQLENEIDV